MAKESASRTAVLLLLTSYCVIALVLCVFMSVWSYFTEESLRPKLHKALMYMNIAFAFTHALFLVMIIYAIMRSYSKSSRCQARQEYCVNSGINDVTFISRDTSERDIYTSSFCENYTDPGKTQNEEAIRMKSETYSENVDPTSSGNLKDIIAKRTNPISFIDNYSSISIDNSDKGNGSPCRISSLANVASAIGAIQLSVETAIASMESIGRTVKSVSTLIVDTESFLERSVKFGNDITYVGKV